MITRRDAAARWRAASTALLTVALAVAAHSLGGGSAPSGAGIALLAVLGVTVGAVAAIAERARAATGVIVLLSVGQVLGHLVSAAAGHSHAAVGPPAPAMLGAHAVAILLGAVLIAAGGRLCRALSAVVRALSAPRPRPARSSLVNATSSDQPLQWLLFLVASAPHRGPPAGSLR